VSEETTEAIAGHISHRMKKRYSHVRIEVMRAAVRAMASPIAPPAELHNQDVLTMLEWVLTQRPSPQRSQRLRAGSTRR